MKYLNEVFKPFVCAILNLSRSNTFICKASLLNWTIFSANLNVLLSSPFYTALSYIVPILYSSLMLSAFYTAFSCCLHFIQAPHIVQILCSPLILSPFYTALSYCPHFIQSSHSVLILNSPLVLSSFHTAVLYYASAILDLWEQMQNMEQMLPDFCRNYAPINNLQSEVETRIGQFLTDARNVSNWCSAETLVCCSLTRYSTCLWQPLISLQLWQPFVFLQTVPPTLTHLCPILLPHTLLMNPPIPYSNAPLYCRATALYWVHSTPFLHYHLPLHPPPLPACWGAEQINHNLH